MRHFLHPPSIIAATCRPLMHLNQSKTTEVVVLVEDEKIAAFMLFDSLSVPLCFRKRDVKVR